MNINKNKNMSNLEETTGTVDPIFILMKALYRQADINFPYGINQGLIFMPGTNNIYNQPPKSQNITVFFKRDFGNVDRIMVQCKLDDKFSSVIEKYRNKTNDKESQIFIFNAKRLNPELTCAEVGLIDNAVILACECRCGFK